MKKVFHFIFATLVATLFSSCAEQWFKTYIASVDYYTAGLNGKVFLSESNSVSFEYTPIGSIYMYQKHGYVKGKSDKKQKSVKGDPIYGTIEMDGYKPMKGGYRWASYESVLEAASESAIKMGGDGIINLQLTLQTDPGNKKIKYPAVSGMVIKRK